MAPSVAILPAMYLLPIILFTLAMAFGPDAMAACGGACGEGCAGKAKPASCCSAGKDDGLAKEGEELPGHPLRGVVLDVLPEKKSLLVKHEEIPGVMAAMTMLLRVDDATLASARKEQAIVARLTREDGVWWLRHVKPVAPPASP